jgi:hypothetical protein
MRLKVRASRAEDESSSAARQQRGPVAAKSPMQARMVCTQKGRRQYCNRLQARGQPVKSGGSVSIRTSQPAQSSAPF